MNALVKKLVVMDVMPLLYRGHFAFMNRPRMTSTGVNTSAIYIFATLVREMAFDEGATHLALVMDTSPTFRHERYPDYKAQRQKLPEDIAASIPMAEAFARAIYRHLKQADKEGAVFKDLEAPWTAGRPSSGGSQLKCKFWASCSCVVTGVNAQRSVEVSLSGRPVGNVTIPPNFNLPSVGRVVEIRYLYVAGENGSLYQPVYLGERDEIDADDCTLERQHLKYKPAA